MRPRDYVLFNPGPVNLHPRIKETLFDVELCHRQPEFRELWMRVRDRLYKAAGLTPQTHRLSLLHGSGALAVDASLVSLVRHRVLVIENGVYGERMRKTLEGIEAAAVETLSWGWGAPPDLDYLATRLEKFKPDWVTVVHHETTTGLLNPLEPIANLVKRTGARLLVDAVGSFAAHQVDTRADVICFSSNRGLESLPGIAGVFWRNDVAARSSVPYLDLGMYAHGIPSTPNVQAFIALETALEILACEDRPARYARLARAVWAHGSRHFEPLLPEGLRSNVLTAFRCGDRRPTELAERAHEHGFVIFEGQGKLASEIFRVSNLGAEMTEERIQMLFDVLGS